MGAGVTRSTVAPRWSRREDFSVDWSEGMHLRSSVAEFEFQNIGSFECLTMI